MSNFDRIKDMSLDEMEEFLQDAEYRSPWADEFAEACCKTCEPEMVPTDEFHRPMQFYPCDYEEHHCPHGDIIRWWLEQEAKV